MKQYCNLIVALLAAGFAAPPVAAARADALLPTLERARSAPPETVVPVALSAQSAANRNPRRANFVTQSASPAARYMADWVVDSGDNKRMPFAIVDKVEAKVFIFGADGALRGATRALLGLSPGDDAVPDIGKRTLSAIRPHERTTPAGRFEAALGPSLSGGTVLWVNYDEGIALHALRATNLKEHRAERLASATTLDKRISFGCIVVPVQFFKNIVRPAFTRSDGIVYVLPETKPLGKVFAAYDVTEHARAINANRAKFAQAAPATVTR